MQLSFSIEVPKLGDFLVEKSRRAHNRIVKQVVTEVLTTHWRKRIPGHFQRPAHQKYGYAERNKRYRIQKQRKYGTSIDLVRTGRTRHAMTTQYRITIGGQGDGVVGKLHLRFPFAGGTRRFRKPGSRQAITIEQMAREIETITPDEIREINEQVLAAYLKHVETDTSPRQRVKV
ncbi:MAG TPA: hypothetical protein VJ783_27060 [Pirellulales bacterium]|nr:hypothetical protein [Pirellulales bacterium]